MKYTLLINQIQAIKLGLSLQEAILLDILSSAATWAEPIHLNEEEYYWVTRQKILLELPIRNIKSDTLYRKLKSLHKKWFIKYLKKGKKDYIRITDLGKLYSHSKKKKSNRIPSKIGKKSKKNSNQNPTDKTTKNNAITKLLSKQKVREKYSRKIVLNGSFVSYEPFVTFSLTDDGLLKNDFNHTILSVRTHREDINNIWTFIYKNHHLIGISEPKELA